MSIVPYNLDNKIVYHDPNHGFMVLYNNSENKIQLLSTIDNFKTTSSSSNNVNGSSSRFNGSNNPGENMQCPNCGFSWPNYTKASRSTDTSNILLDDANFYKDNIHSFSKKILPEFMHHDYFKLLGNLPYSKQSKINFSSLPEDIFNQGYFKKFFTKIPPYTLGSGAHSQVYKVMHVLNDIKLGVYALKRISIGDKYEFLKQVLNEVLILYELSVKGANENNLIRYNHVWLELGDIEDSSSFILSNEAENPSDKKSSKIPYVFILQQYCDGGHLEDLITNTYQLDKNLSEKDKINLEREKRRSIKRGIVKIPDVKKKNTWLTDFEIWKFFRDVVNGVHYLHAHSILHRDLKPSNCLLDIKYQSNTQKHQFKSLHELNDEAMRLPKVLVSDFGEGKFLNKHNIEENRVSASERRGNTGTLEFTAPELWFSNYDPSLEIQNEKFIHDFTYESDIYSLGLILCWLCIGILPFSIQIENQTDPQIIRSKIVEWYLALTPESFHEWFHSEITNRGAIMTSFMTTYERLIYLMVKGRKETSDRKGSRILSSEVLECLQDMKQNFIEEHKFFDSSDIRLSSSEHFNNSDIEDEDLPANDEQVIDLTVNDSNDTILNINSKIATNHSAKGNHSFHTDHALMNYFSLAVYVFSILFLDMLYYNTLIKSCLLLKTMSLSSLLIDLFFLKVPSSKFTLALTNIVLLTVIVFRFRHLIVDILFT